MAKIIIPIVIRRQKENYKQKNKWVIKSRRLKWAGNVARMEEGRSAFKILTGYPTGKRPLGRPRRRWKNNIRIDLKEIGINTRSWIDSAQDRDYYSALVNEALSLRVPEANGVS